MLALFRAKFACNLAIRYSVFRKELLGMACYRTHIFEFSNSFEVSKRDLLLYWVIEVIKLIQSSLTQTYWSKRSSAFSSFE